MEIPRHWRLKDFRYRLIGWKYECGAVEIMPRSKHQEQENKLPADRTIYHEVASFAYSSKLSLYTSDNCTVEPEKLPQMQEQ